MIRRILDDIFARMERFGESVSGTRRRAERIYRMWGEGLNAGRGREITERTLKRLDRLLYRVLGLMDSRLYRRIPRCAPAPRALRMTNLSATMTTSAAPHDFGMSGPDCLRCASLPLASRRRSMLPWTRRSGNSWPERRLRCLTDGI